jgi:hypothetical protein
MAVPRAHIPLIDTPVFQNALGNLGDVTGHIVVVVHESVTLQVADIEAVAVHVGVTFHLEGWCGRVGRANAGFCLMVANLKSFCSVGVVTLLETVNSSGLEKDVQPSLPRARARQA